ncbi:glycosyltransferase [Microvirga arsenatis]|uniref:Glycosyltransferase n=1 Tax=Microvirga arsenatis TaxID=2692265 RepID=A0ABW9YWB0_9HYPH|nr:glycosyltransferase [Microvirga arsenatis]NBJ11595.1 glycosyltransferase [Microvirga arsenatis]NBJ22804.1 glycosyltransferase [Microvirga arsenatis]
MNLLLLHPNFPGQFKRLAKELMGREEWRIVGIGEGERGSGGAERITYRGYSHPTGPAEAAFPLGTDFAEHARRGRTVADLAQALKDKGFRPDVILAHPGWGDALFVPEVFPEARFIAYLEYFYRAQDSDLDFDPELRVRSRDLRTVPLRNATNLLAFAAADCCVTPTRWQAGLFPPQIGSQIEVIHEGIDTAHAAPNPAAAFALPNGAVLSQADEVVTYVSRSLEPYRGFHVFMRSLPEILKRRPKAQVVLVGREEISYGQNHASGQSWKRVMLEEVGADLDMSRVHFLGQLPYDAYLDLLRVSSVHVYLTYPFVLSWSFLEAMACGCTMLGSATGPVLEVLKDGENGRSVGFFDRAALVDTLCELLDDPAQRRRLSQAARETVLEHYDFKTRTFPRYLDLLTQ